MVEDQKSSKAHISQRLLSTNQYHTFHSACLPPTSTDHFTALAFHQPVPHISQRLPSTNSPVPDRLNTWPTWRLVQPALMEGLAVFSAATVMPDDFAMAMHVSPDLTV